jgi:hypothetical protein
MVRDVEREMSESQIERLAKHYGNGDVLDEFVKRMKQFTNNFWEVSRDELSLDVTQRDVTITIDGTKECFMGNGDAMESLEEDDLFTILRVAMWLHEGITIKPANAKNLSIQFWWSRE